MTYTAEENLLTKLEVNNLDQDGVQCNFQRTCRVPEGRINSLPAGLGSFPIYKVSDFKSGAPKDWKEEGYFFPMYKQEAMWINFSRNYRNPRAMIIAAGNINAITGKPFDLSKDKFARNRRKKKSGKKKSIKNFLFNFMPLLSGIIFFTVLIFTQGRHAFQDIK